MFISTLCAEIDDEMLCGIRDDASASPAANIANLDATEVIDSTVRVALKLRDDGNPPLRRKLHLQHLVT